MNGISENRQKKSKKDQENLRVLLLKHLIFKKEQEKYVELLMEEDDWDDLIEVNVGNNDRSQSKMETCEPQSNQVTSAKRQIEFMEESAAKRMKI
jgi:hypothetical protein